MYLFKFFSFFFLSDGSIMLKIYEWYFLVLLYISTDVLFQGLTEEELLENGLSKRNSLFLKMGNNNTNGPLLSLEEIKKRISIFSGIVGLSVLAPHLSSEGGMMSSIIWNPVSTYSIIKLYVVICIRFNSSNDTEFFSQTTMELLEGYLQKIMGCSLIDLTSYHFQYPEGHVVSHTCNVKRDNDVEHILYYYISNVNVLNQFYNLCQRAIRRNALRGLRRYVEMGNNKTTWFAESMPGSIYKTNLTGSINIHGQTIYLT